MIEVLIAAAITAVIAGGALAAYVASSRMMGQQNSPASAEAAGFAQQTIERYRNMIACDSPWFNPATCTAGAGLPTTWTSDALPSSAAAGSESILQHTPAPKRCYLVQPLAACTAGAGTPDCFQLQAKVCWGDYTQCPCPP